MRKKNKRRMHSSLGYYGFGGLSAVFSRRPKPIFEKIKTIYGDEMERYSLERSSTNKFHQDIPKIELEKIRNKVRIAMKSANRKEFLKQTLFLTLVAIAVIICYNLL
ncbi:hypothetical protein RQM59_00500 [Flavobacteriaceae bacterium S356]|uniref:Uncharacterized protein n=1 Tax=Asprobacillus argus TaxID=3076534 RepID=A0ABU3LC26_9FLAO|nr:hypothetical protein [Flavobacteriaceae bacterium S356]